MLVINLVSGILELITQWSIEYIIYILFLLVQFDEWCLCRLYRSKSAKKTREDDPQENLVMEADAELIAPQEHNGQEPNAGALLIAPQEHNGRHVAGELHNNFAGQITAAPFADQNIIAQQQYNGRNAGPSVNFTQQSTTMDQQSTTMAPSNHAIWNQNNSNYMENATSSSINGFHYYSDALNDQQNIYPLNVTGYVQPLRSLPPNGFPTSSNYNTDQSSSDTLDYNVTSEWEFDYPSSLFPDNGQSSFDIDFTFDDFDL